MDELRLDGNAAAGALGEVFSFEATTAEYACRGAEGRQARGGDGLRGEGAGHRPRCRDATTP
jgi:hypothetical protein